MSRIALIVLLCGVLVATISARDSDETELFESELFEEDAAPADPAHEFKRSEALVQGKRKGKSSGGYYTTSYRRGSGSRRRGYHDKNCEGGEKDCDEKSGACFPSSATVHSKRLGRKTRIAKLKVGDSVLTHHGWAEVLFFAVHQPKAAGSHLELTTANSTVVLSSTHAVFKEDGSPVLAGEVREGDTLLSAGKVLTVKRVAAKGLIAPVTSTGSLVVNGVSTSDYGPLALRHGQRVAHAALSPLRALRWMFPKWSMWNAHKEDGHHPFKTWGSWLLQL